MTGPFGKRKPLKFAATVAEVPTYRKARESGDNEVDRICAWTAYFALVFAGITSFAPEAAAEVIIKIAISTG